MFYHIKSNVVLYQKQWSTTAKATLYHITSNVLRLLATPALAPRRLGTDLFFKKRVIVDLLRLRRFAISDGATESSMAHCFTKRTSSDDKVVPGMALPYEGVGQDARNGMNSLPLNVTYVPAMHGQT